MQFLAWWCACYLALVLLALAEGIFLRQIGVEYHSKSSLRHVSVRSFSVSADGRWAASQLGFTRWSSGSGTREDVVLHNLRQHTVSPLNLGNLNPCCVTMAPTADRVAIGCLDGSIYLGRCPVHRSTSETGKIDGELRLLYRAHHSWITRLVFAPDGRQLAAVGERDIYLLRVIPAREVGSAVLVRRWPCRGDSTTVAFSGDSQNLLVFGFDGEMRSYDSQGGQLMEGKNGAIHSTLSSDGKLAAYMFADGRLSVQNVTAGHQLWYHDIASYYHEAFSDNARDTMSFSPDGRVLVTACWTRETFRIHGYDAVTGVCLGKSPRYETALKGLVITADHVVYFWDSAGVIRGWKVGQDREQWRFSWPLTTRARPADATPA